MHRALRVAAFAGLTALVAWVLFFGLPRWYLPRPASSASAAATAPTPPPPGRKIKARLYYVGDDGARLTSVERDVPYGEGTAEQAKAIVNAQIAPVTDPLVSAVPAGTKLLALFVTERGDAFVDLSREVASAHPGGATSELLTVYAIVNALTTNLPAVTRVQVLAEGKELDTLAGHVDLRHPLPSNLEWIQ